MAIRTTTSDLSNSQLVYTLQCQPPPRGYESFGDAEFTGFQGQEFRLSGMSGSIYNLYTSSKLQINAKFMHFDSACASSSQTCVGQAGTYIKSIGVAVRHAHFNDNSINTTNIHVMADSKNNNLNVKINDKPFQPTDSTINFSQLFHIVYSSPSRIVIHTSTVCFTITNSDGFLNQELELNDSFLKPKHLLTCQ